MGGVLKRSIARRLTTSLGVFWLEAGYGFFNVEGFGCELEGPDRLAGVLLEKKY